MAQPTPYNRLSNFTDYATANPAATYNAADHDAELNAVELTLDETLANLALVQRDDGLLRNASVHPDSLTAATLTLMSTWTAQGDWATATSYVVNDFVTEVGVWYVCLVAHASGTFATDLAAGKWMAFSNNPAIGVAPAGGTTIALARPGTVHTGGVPATATAEGFDATPIVTEIYYSELFVPCNMQVTGISVFNGSVASDDWHRALLDADGALVVGSATGAVTSSGADVYQKVPFTGGAITLLGPATYYVAQICDGTVDRYNAHGEGTTELGFALNLVAGKITGQTYGAIPATNTLTLTFTTDLGPIASLY